MRTVETDAKAIFLEALDFRDGVEQSSFVARACGTDVDLQSRVAELLRADRDAGDFLRGQNAVTVDLPLAEAPGAMVGPYKLMEQVGAGGMGLVFVAEQQVPVRRKVAVKVIKPGMDTREVVARFEAERQALALMDHPNIARVFDAGATASGRPYFVMGLVRGVDIGRFCDENCQTTRERLGLFVDVCQAVQHAHHKGIIHRDLKASNILVTLHAGTPVVEVIDFGVAKAVGQQLTDKTVSTRFAPMIGTPMSMSPEQAELSGLDIDTRSDIDALGVLLYELLTGATPFESGRLRAAGFDEVRRIIREEQPPRPSTRVSTLGPAAAATLCASRRSEPARLSRLFRGELDWIVMKALEEDRNRRHETASGFAADVLRYLRDEPVHACPPTLTYRLGKLGRRYRKAATAAAVLATALVRGMVGTTFQAVRATTAAAAAVREARLKADALADRELALEGSTEQLYQALVSRARAERGSGRVGQRFEALEAIREAAKIRVSPELRTEATAALALPDAELVEECDGPTGNVGSAFDATLRRYALLDVQFGVVVCRLNGGREEVVARLDPRVKHTLSHVVMTPDARYVACGYGATGDLAGDGVRVWRVEGAKLLTLDPAPPGVHEAAIAFDPSGRRLAVGHGDGTVGVYDLPSGRRVLQLAVRAAPMHLAFRPHADRLAVASGRAVLLFDTGTGKELPALPHPYPVRCVSWHPDGHRLATACNDRKIRVWDTRTAAEVMAPWAGHMSDGVDIAYNPAGDRLVSVDWSSPPRLWDAVTGRTLFTLPGFGVQFSAGGELFGPGGGAGKVGLWRFASGRELRVLRPRNAGSLGNIAYPVVHADGRTLAATTRRGLCFFDLVSGEELASARLTASSTAFPTHSEPPGAGGGVPGGGWVTGVTTGCTFGRPAATPRGPRCCGSARRGRSPRTPAAATPPARARAPTAASSSCRRATRPWCSTATGRGGGACSARSTTSGTLLLAPTAAESSPARGGPSGTAATVRVWDAETGQPVRDLATACNATAAFSPDGHYLMTRTARESKQWEVAAWAEVRRFAGGHFAFSPDKRLVAVNDAQPGEIRLLDTATGREVARLTGPEPTWYAPACFTPDGTRLVATSAGETGLYVWDLRLIREQLKALGLDWDWPEFPPAAPADPDAKPPQVEVVLGELTRPTFKLNPQRKAWVETLRHRAQVAANPDNALACNDLAWTYATGPEAGRHAKAAVTLAENAVRLEPKSAAFRNTLGVAYYRVGRYRDAVTALQRNLDTQEE